MNTGIVLPAFALLVLFASAGWTAAPQDSQESMPEEITVPAGTVIPVILTAYLNTRSSQAGDVFYADTTYPIWVQQRLVIPKGSTVRGTVTEVLRPGKIKGKGRLAVRFDDILLPNGIRRDFIATFRGLHSAGDEDLDRKSETVTAGGSEGADVGTVVATTGQGAIIGALISRGSGAGIGAAAGAAGGIATVLFTRGRDLVLPPGTQFDLELKRPIKFAYNEVQFTNAELNRVQRAQPGPARAPSPGGRQTGPLAPRLGPFGLPFPF